MKAKTSSAKSRKLLLINLGSPSEVILSVQAIRSLREERLDAKFYLLVYNLMADIGDDLPFLKKTIALKDREYGRGWRRRVGHLRKMFRENLSLIKELRRERFELAINFGGGWHGAIIALLCRAGLNAGCRNSFLSRFLNLKIDRVTNRHKAQEHLDLVKALGVLKPGAGDRTQRLRISAEDKKFVNDFLALNHIGRNDLLIGLDPSSSDPQDRWDKDHMALLANRFIEHLGGKVIIMGDIEDLTYVQGMLSYMKDPPIIATGKLCLGQIKALAARCKLVAGTNPATIHLASGIGTKVIFLHRSGNFDGSRPLGRGDIVISTEALYQSNGRSDSGKRDKIEEKIVDNVVRIAEFQLKSEVIGGIRA